MHLIVKDRILLHLMERGRALAPEASPETTQEGLARAAGVAVRHVSQYIRPLVKDGLVEERMAHVEGIRQRRRVYTLTDSGRLAAIRLRELVKPEPIRVRDDAGVRQETVGSVLAAVKGQASLLAILRRAEEGEAVDVRALTEAPAPVFVEMTEGKPEVQRFVGRRRELELVTEGQERARFIVVRGVAGIGKTWLAAEACKRLRGSRNLFWHRVRPWDTPQSVLLHVGEFLAVLGKPALRAVLERGHLDRAPDILRRDLTGSRSVLVFDDAHEATESARHVFRMLLEALETAADVRVLLLSRRAVPVYDRRDVVLGGLVEEIDLSGLDPQDVAAYLSMDGGPVASAPFGQGVLRHPLLLELYRARREAPSLAEGDVRRYIEEVLYSELPPPERRMMAVASLYEVPVPQDALFAEPGWSRDVLLALENRGLIRPVSDGRLESHDAIREVFRALLAPAEREAYGGFTVGRLRELAAGAWADKQYARCADYLSNALRLTANPAEEAEMRERLADVQARMGDLLALTVSYRQALRGSTDPVALARLHRKLAAALCAHGEFDGAVVELDAGFQCLGDLECGERAWLELVWSRLSNRRYDFVTAREHGEAALHAFSAQGDDQGKVEANIELGDATSLLGTQGPDGAALADGYYEEAIRLADSLADPLLAVNARLSLNSRIMHRHGDVPRLSALLEEIAERSEVLDDPFIAAGLLLQEGWVKLNFRGDFEAAVADLTEAVRIAKEVHDANATAENTYMLGAALRTAGRVSEARPLLEGAAAEMVRLKLPPNRCLFVYSWAGECYLVEGDRPGFLRLLNSMGRLGLTERSWLHLRPLRAFACVLGGDFGGARMLLERGIQVLGEFSTGEAQFHAIERSQLEVYYAAALEAMGDRSEADAHHACAVEIFRTHHFRGRLLTLEYRQHSIAEGIRRIWGDRCPTIEAPSPDPSPDPPPSPPRLVNVDNR